MRLALDVAVERSEFFRLNGLEDSGGGLLDRWRGCGGGSGSLAVGRARSGGGIAEGKVAYFLKVLIDEVLSLAAGEAEVLPHVAEGVPLIVGHIVRGEAAETDEAGKLGARVIGWCAGSKPRRSGGGRVGEETKIGPGSVTRGGGSDRDRGDGALRAASAEF
jgi:hypothetical protein